MLDQGAAQFGFPPPRMGVAVIKGFHELPPLPRHGMATPGLDKLIRSNRTNPFPADERRDGLERQSLP